MSDPDPTPDAPPSTEAPAAISFEWNDETWTAPADGDDWDIDASLALEQGRTLTFLTLVLGTDQMRQFRSGNRRSSGDAAALMNAMLIAMKVGPAPE